MGRSGDLLRAAKKQAAVYTFTAEQLQEHDRQVVLSKKERLEDLIAPQVEAEMARREAEIDAYIKKTWDDRAREFQSHEPKDNMLHMLQYLLAVSCRVLIEHFHWQPIPMDGAYDRRNRTMRFAEYIAEEIEKISETDAMDIRAYSEETFKLYGVKFKVIGDDGEVIDP